MADTGRHGGSKKKVCLALQGGGSHGAFTWGVLDRMLEEPTLDIIGVTGTSAGAMNAIMLADGLVRGGPELARQRLREFWHAIGAAPGFGSLLWMASGETQAKMQMGDMPHFAVWDVLRTNFSPNQLNPMRFNPLRDPILNLVDFDRLRAEKNFQVMVCATNVRTARRRVFTNEDISVDAVLASACLPLVFPAVEIDGDAYWDGGYTGNPAMFALMRRMPKCDMMIVRIDPIERREVPQTTREIQDRITELGFNTTFWLELTMMAALLGLVEQGALDRERFGRFFFHAIQASSEFEKIHPSTKLNNSSAFLDHLFRLGQATADDWFARNGEKIGHESTIDLLKLLPADWQMVPPSERENVPSS